MGFTLAGIMDAFRVVLELVRGSQGFIFGYKINRLLGNIGL